MSAAYFRNPKIHGNKSRVQTRFARSVTWKREPTDSFACCGCWRVAPLWMRPVRKTRQENAVTTARVLRGEWRRNSNSCTCNNRSHPSWNKSNACQSRTNDFRQQPRHLATGVQREMVEAMTALTDKIENFSRSRDLLMGVEGLDKPDQIRQQSSWLTKTKPVC